MNNEDPFKNFKPDFSDRIVTIFVCLKIFVFQNSIYGHSIYGIKMYKQTLYIYYTSIKIYIYLFKLNRSSFYLFIFLFDKLFLNIFYAFLRKIIYIVRRMFVSMDVLYGVVFYIIGH